MIFQSGSGDDDDILCFWLQLATPVPASSVRPAGGKSLVNQVATLPRR
jgi:hypothetical protein